MLLDSSFCSLSTPVDLTWLDEVRNVEPKREIFLVGEGVTSQEYSFILNRSSITFKSISTEQFLKQSAEARSNRESGKPFFIFAAPSKLAELSIKARSLELHPSDDYFTHFDALRNRMIIDFRCYDACDTKGLADIIDSAITLPTLGGIDILSTSSSLLREIGLLIADRSKLFHTKAILYFDPIAEIRVQELTGFNAIEINATHLNGDNDADVALVEALLYTLEADTKSYLTVTEEMLSKFGDNSAGRIYQDTSQEWYFDSMLLDLESGSVEHSPRIKTSKTNMCLSRRMFPVLDQRLMLKKCSLYDALGKTDIPYSDIQKNQFTNERNALCERCIKFKLHRIA